MLSRGGSVDFFLHEENSWRRLVKESSWTRKREGSEGRAGGRKRLGAEKGSCLCCLDRRRLFLLDCHQKEYFQVVLEEAFAGRCVKSVGGESCVFRMLGCTCRRMQNMMTEKACALLCKDSNMMEIPYHPEEAGVPPEQARLVYREGTRAQRKPLCLPPPGSSF